MDIRLSRPGGGAGPQQPSESRHGPLADGQVFEWWKQYSTTGGSLVVLPLPLPRPLPEAHVRAAVHTLVERHEALRTSVELDGGGRPRQVVHPAGARELRFEVVPDSTPRDDADLITMLWRGQIDVAHEPPLWVCLFRTADGQITELVIVFSHVVVDATGTDIIKGEFAELLRARVGGRAHRLPPVERHLLDIAMGEAAPRLRPERDNAENYWRDRLRAAPNRMFPGRHRTRFQLYSGTLVSTTAPATLAVAAQRFRSTPATLYSALVSTLLAVVSGHREPVLHTHYHGRSPEAAGVVGCFHRILFTVLDLTDEPPLSQILKRAMAETMGAQRRHRISWARLKQWEGLETLRRGAAFADGSTLNFDTVDSYEDDHRRPGRYSPELVRAPQVDLQLNPAEIVDGDRGMEAYLMVRLSTDRLLAHGGFDGDVLRYAEMDALLRGPEVLLHEALRRGDLGFAELTALAAAHGWSARPPAVRVANSLVDTGYLGEVLAEHPDVVAAHAHLEPEGRLVAFAGTTSPGLRPWQLRDYLLDRVSPSAALVCPENFVVVAGVPEHRADPAAWLRLPRIAEGSGLDRPDQPPAGEPAATLLAAVAWATARDDIAGTRTYLEAGGDLTVVPAILRRLAAGGLTGLCPDDFLRPVSLLRLADGLSESP